MLRGHLRQEQLDDLAPARGARAPGAGAPAPGAHRQRPPREDAPGDDADAAAQRARPREPEVPHVQRALKVLPPDGPRSATAADGRDAEGPRPVARRREEVPAREREAWRAWQFHFLLEKADLKMAQGDFRLARKTLAEGAAAADDAGDAPPRAPSRSRSCSARSRSASPARARARASAPRGMPRTRPWARWRRRRARRSARR